MNDLGYISYLPPGKRKPDTQFRDLIEEVYRSKKVVHPIQGGEAKMIPGAQHHYPAENGFVMETMRDLSGAFKGALAEHIGFLNGAATLDELVAFGMPKAWWERWVTPEKCADFSLPAGNLGSASYGPIWTKYPTRDGGTFNQIDALQDGIKDRPHLRTWRVTPWYPPEVIGPYGTRRVVVAPCHGEIHALADPETKELFIHHWQRSGDLLVGVKFNRMQYFAFGMMLAKLMGYRFVELIYTFSDAHIYECQYPYVEELLTREARIYPTVTIEANRERLQDFRPEDFVLGNDYNPHPKMNIPTPT
jgi:thymidylate synthase